VATRVALATCAEFPQLADDEPMLLDELRARGVDAEPAVWDDPAVDWDRYALVVIRCTWDYSWRREEFLAWAEAVPRLLNTADVVRWNTDKRYLTTLPGAVATEFVDRAAAWRPPDGEFVVKPTISSGSRHTARYGPGDEEQASAHVRELMAAGRTVMVQPYLDAVDEHGETALLFLGGEYSHAIRKGQMLRPGHRPSTELFLPEQITARTPDQAELTLADRILDGLPWPRSALLYARIDLIPGADGRPRLVELELTEPSLYFSFGEGSARRLADLVIGRL
jgi:glutathione synthase/RimK-type ligase-like ATP-grasp enzyme